MKYLHVEVPDADLERWKLTAQKRGLSLSAWVRMTLGREGSVSRAAERVGTPVVAMGATYSLNGGFRADCPDRSHHVSGTRCDACGGVRF